MNSIPEDLAQLLKECIWTVDDMEIMRVLAIDRSRTWSSAALAQEMHVSENSIAPSFQHLTNLGLVTVLDGPCVRYKFGPENGELEARMSRLVTLYNERPVTLIRLILEFARNRNET